MYYIELKYCDLFLSVLEAWGIVLLTVSTRFKSMDNSEAWLYFDRYILLEFLLIIIGVYI